MSASRPAALRACYQLGNERFFIVALTPADASRLPPAKQAASIGPKARLILQDPSAFDRETKPVLRLSSELDAQPAVTDMQREQARSLWESLSLEPEMALMQQDERKRLLQRAENSKLELAASKTQALELQAQLVKAQDERLNHPVVYAGAATLIGVASMWFLERRQRMRLQQRELERLAQQSPSLVSDASTKSAATSADEAHSYLPQQDQVFLLEDSPDLAHDFATDLMGSADSQPLDLTLPNSALAPVAPLVTPIAPVVAAAVNSGVPIFNQTSTPQASNRSQPQSMDFVPQVSRQAMPRHQEDMGLLAASKQVFTNMLRRRSERGDFNSAVLPTAAATTSRYDGLATVALIDGHLGDTMKTPYDEQAQEALEQELLAHQLNEGLRANYDLVHEPTHSLLSTQMPPQDEQSTLEYLLELRTAVSGLCALGRHDGAVTLLEAHIAENPSTCAWAYLEHLNICEQKGLRQNFEAMRKCYLQQFNDGAPSWHQPSEKVLSLESYTDEVNELCRAWSQGARVAQTVLATWLAGPMQRRKRMQLPAQHDLFDLYELLEYVDAIGGVALTFVASDHQHADLARTGRLAGSAFTTAVCDADESEFVPTVSLLDLDYEFSSDVTLEESQVQQSEKAVTVVKPGNFSVDFNVAGTQMGALASVPAELPKN